MGKFYPLVLAFCCGVFPLRAQSIHFDRLDINDGLSQNTVTSIIQDDKGFMWFGTKDGLCRYDGKSFKTFMHDPRFTAGLGNSLIKRLVQDHGHRIWVGTDSGLYIYDPETEHFSGVPLYAADGKPVTKPISILDCDREGRVWIVVENGDVFCYDPQTREVERRYKPRKPLRSLASDKNGVIWFAGYGGGLYCTEDLFRTVKPFLDADGREIYPQDIISFICLSDYNEMYLGLEERGVAKVDLVSGTVTRLRLSDNPDAPLFVRHILPYSPEELWIRNRVGHRRLQRPHPALPASEKLPVRSLFALRQRRVFALQGPRGRVVDRFVLRGHQLPAPAELRFRKILPHRRSAQPSGPPRAGNLPRQRRAALDRHGGCRALHVRSGDGFVWLLRPEPGVLQRPRTADGRRRPLGEHLLERHPGDRHPDGPHPQIRQRQQAGTAVQQLCFRPLQDQRRAHLRGNHARTPVLQPRDGPFPLRPGDQRRQDGPRHPGGFERESVGGDLLQRRLPLRRAQRRLDAVPAR